jgi:hypothetical protein
MLVASVVALTLCTPLRAQSAVAPSRRFWAALDASAAGLRLGGDPYDSPVVGRIAASLHLGVTASRRVALGLEVGAWQASPPLALSRSVVFGLVGAQWQPTRWPAWLSGRVGALAYKETAPGGSQRSASAIAVEVGLGYDIPLSPAWALTPHLSYLTTFGVGVSGYGTRNGEPLDLRGMTPQLLRAGVRLTWRE